MGKENKKEAQAQRWERTDSSFEAWLPPLGKRSKQESEKQENKDVLHEWNIPPMAAAQHREPPKIRESEAGLKN